MREQNFKTHDGPNYLGGNCKLGGEDLSVLVPTTGGCCELSHIRNGRQVKHEASCKYIHPESKGVRTRSLY